MSEEQPKKSSNAAGVLAVIAVGAVALGIGASMKPSPKTPGAAPASAASRPADDAVSAAYRLCEAAKGSGMASDCDVSGWGKAVEIRVDTNAAQARVICAGMAEQMASASSGFRGKGWKLRVFSPFSGEHQLAECDLK